MNGEQPLNGSIENIIGGAAAEEGAAADALGPDDLRALAERVDLLTADFGRWDSYKAASTEYVKEFTAEVRWHRWVRFGVTVAGVALMAFLIGCLVVAIKQGSSLFGDGQGHALTALVGGSILGCVVVSIALIKGAYSNLADRNAGLPMPDHLKEIVDLSKSYMGKGV